MVIQRINGGLKPVARFREFAKLGMFGRAGDISPIAIAGDDGFVVESAVESLGRTRTRIDFFVFSNGILKDLDATPPIMIRANEPRVAGDEKTAIVVDATWFFDPADRTALVVDYKIVAKGGTRIERAVWRLEVGRLVLSKGRPPPELADGAPG